MGRGGERGEGGSGVVSKVINDKPSQINVGGKSHCLYDKSLSLVNNLISKGKSRQGQSLWIHY